MCQTITSRRGGCRQGGQDGVAGHVVDHLEPSEVQQQTNDLALCEHPWGCPGAVSLECWLAVASRRPWWLSMSGRWLFQPCWFLTRCSSWPAAPALEGTRWDVAWPVVSGQSWWPDGGRGLGGQPGETSLWPGRV